MGREGLEPPTPGSSGPRSTSWATSPILIAIRDLQPRSDCRLKLQRCRLFTLHGRGYLPGRFSTFPIGSVCGHMWDSNPRHPACKASVLPTELMAHVRKSRSYRNFTYPTTIRRSLQPPQESTFNIPSFDPPRHTSVPRFSRDASHIVSHAVPRTGFLVGLAGLEPTTSASQMPRSSQLNYNPIL